MESEHTRGSVEGADGGSRSRSDRKEAAEPDPVRKKTLKKVQDYVLGDVLGEGSYGQVREGLMVSDSNPKLKFGQRVAVKIISRRLLTRKVRNGQENLKREITCLKKLKHQNVIQLYDVIDDPSLDKVYLVFELANFLSLQDILDLTQKNVEHAPSIKSPFENWENLQNLFHQLVVGLAYCHSKGVVHRDIKPSNLQLTLDGVLKIIDFGVAELLEKYSELDDTEKFAGTPSFQPPEVAKGTRSFSATKVDIWAAGVTLYVMATGSMPFTGENTEQLYGNISAGEYHVPPHLPELLRDLIIKIMNPDPEERPTLDAILKHPWLEGQDRAPPIQLHVQETGTKKNTLLQRYMEEDSDEEGEEEEEEDKDEPDDLNKARVGLMNRFRVDSFTSLLEMEEEYKHEAHDLNNARVGLINSRQSQNLQSKVVNVCCVQ